VKILGDRYHLEILSQLYKVQQIFIAVSAAPLHEIKKILKICRDLGLRPQPFLTKAEGEGEETTNYFGQGGDGEARVLKASPSDDPV